VVLMELGRGEEFIDVQNRESDWIRIQRVQYSFECFHWDWDIDILNDVLAILICCLLG
jgi:hypothetical protein